MDFLIKKASGEKEPFNLKKFKRSLKRCGAPDKVIMKIAQKIEKKTELRSTKQIYEFALEELKKINPALAARYNLKQALILLGPSGFPFELFIEKIFEEQGYTVERNQYVNGFCILHELDLIAKKNNTYLMIECKFHNRQKYKADVKIPLYIKARFDDVEKAWKLKPEHFKKFHQAWIATNTKFTSDAVQYSECAGIKLLDWKYPYKASLPVLIKKHTLYPITTLTTLSLPEKKALIKKGLILCRDIKKKENILKEIGLKPSDRRRTIKEAVDLCTVNDILNGHR